MEISLECTNRLRYNLLKLEPFFRNRTLRYENATEEGGRGPAYPGPEGI